MMPCVGRGDAHLHLPQPRLVLCACGNLTQNRHMCSACRKRELAVDVAYACRYCRRPVYGSKHVCAECVLTGKRDGVYLANSRERGTWRSAASPACRTGCMNPPSRPRPLPTRTFPTGGTLRAKVTDDLRACVLAMVRGGMSAKKAAATLNAIGVVISPETAAKIVRTDGGRAADVQPGNPEPTGTTERAALAPKRRRPEDRILPVTCTLCGHTGGRRAGIATRVGGTAHKYRCVSCGHVFLPAESRAKQGQSAQRARALAMAGSGVSVQEAAAAIGAENAFLAHLPAATGAGKALPKHPGKGKEQSEYRRVCACGNYVAGGYSPCASCLGREKRHGADGRSCILCRRPRKTRSPFCHDCREQNHRDGNHANYVKSGRGDYGPAPRYRHGAVRAPPAPRVKTSRPRKAAAKTAKPTEAAKPPKPPKPSKAAPRKPAARPPKAAKPGAKKPRKPPVRMPRVPGRPAATPDTAASPPPKPRVRPPHKCDDEYWRRQHGFVHGRSPGAYVPYCWHCRGYFETDSQLRRKCPCCGRDV